MRKKDEERTYTVTQEEYDAEIASGLTDEEVLRPGTYKIRRNPWAEKLRKAGKSKVTVYHHDGVVEQFWLKMGK
jgi:hypothetical protein